MTDSPETKPAWEIAWEEQYPGDARHMNSSSPQPFRMVRERWRFQHGYETGYDVGLKEAELGASRTPVEAGASRHPAHSLPIAEKLPRGQVRAGDAMSEPATTCPDCGRLTARYATWLDDFDGVCAGATQASDALLNCRKVTIANLRAQLADAHEVSLELCRWETWAVMQLSVDPDLHGEAMRAAATAKLAEATKLREAAWDAGHQAGCQLALSSENDDGFGYENYGKHTNPYRKSVKRG